MTNSAHLKFDLRDQKHSHSKLEGPIIYISIIIIIIIIIIKIKYQEKSPTIHDGKHALGTL